MLEVWAKVARTFFLVRLPLFHVRVGVSVRVRVSESEGGESE